MRIKNGGQLLAGALSENGITHVFGLHGGHLDAFLFGLEDEGIPLIDVRHEAAAVHAADGYSRSTGKLGVATVTSGPGVTNAVTGAAVANVDSVPVVIIGGAPPLRDDERFVLQGGVDQVALMATVTKHSFRATDIRRIPEYVDRAIRLATRGRPGPVYLEVPIDVLFDRIDDSKVRSYPAVSRLSPTHPDSSDVDQLVEQLRNAERPVVICGNGVLYDGAQQAVRIFAETHDVPVFGNSRALGILPNEHRLYGGNVSGLASLPEHPDLVVLAGARASQMTLGTPGKSFVDQNTYLVEINSDVEEIGRSFTVDLGINASIGTTLEDATSRAQGTITRTERWARDCHATTERHVAVFGPEAQAHETGIHPYYLGEALADTAPAGTIFIGDGSETYHWVEPMVKLDELGHWISHGYFGCLGVGHPYAIGAQVANPNATVIQVVGDGSVGFNLQEFDTMCRHQLPIVTIINSNLAWGISAHGQDALARRRVGTDLPLTSFEGVMKALGGHGELVTEKEQLRPALRRALDAGVPAVVNVATDSQIESPRVRAMMASLKSGTGIYDEQEQLEQPISIPYYDPIER